MCIRDSASGCASRWTSAARTLPAAALRSSDLRSLPKNAFKVAAALDAAAVLGLLYMVHEAQWVRRVDRRLEAPAAAADLDGLTIAQLSDFHVGFRPSFNLRAMRKAVDMALAARPDLVLVTGDFACGPPVRPAREVAGNEDEVGPRGR